MTSSALQLNYNDITTIGIAQVSKALILDSSKNIIGINNIQSATIDCNGLNINNSTDLNLYGTSNTINMHSTTSSSILMSGSIFNSISMSGSAGFINVGGANQYITIANTSASTSSITGALRCSGGIYSGANSLFAQNINVGGSQTLTGSLLISGGIAFQASSGINMNSNSIVNCTTFTLSGIQTSTNIATSSSFNTGALILNGGIGIGSADDATSSTSGGTFTTRGGMAISKSLYVGTNLSVGGTLSLSSLTSIINAQITDTGIANLVYPITVSHLLSSGTPTNNSFGIGMLFNAPNSSNTTISYGRIYSTIQSSTAGSHQGSLTFSSVFNAGFVDGFTLSSSGASTSTLTMLGTSTIIATTLTGTLSTTSQPNITSLGTLTSLTLSGAISGVTTFDSSGNMNINSTFRVTGASNPVTGAGCEINFTSSVSNIYSFNRGTSTYLDLNLNDKMLIASTGIISQSNSTTSTSSTTGSFLMSGGLAISNSTDSISFTNGGSFTTAGGMAISKTLNVANINVNNPIFGTGSAQVNIKSTGYQLNLLNSSQYYTRFATTNQGSLQIELNTNSGSGGFSTIILSYSSATLSTLGLSGISARSGSIIDFGNTATDTSIILYQATTGASIFGMGANNSATELHSGGDFKFYNGTTQHGSLGALQASIFNGGSFQCQGHLRATGFSSTGMTAVSGAEIFWDGSFAQFIGYSRSTFLYKDCIFGGGSIYTSGSTSNVGIKGSNVNGYPLEIASNAHTISTSYGYLTSGGSIGTSSSSGSQQYSLYCSGRILCTGEIDVLSDFRIKKNIEDITEEETEVFIKKIKPKRYELKANPNQFEYGYIAQDICKAEISYHKNLNALITQHNEMGLEEFTDEEGFTSPKDVSLAVNYVKIIPLLHKYILMQDEKIEANNKIIKELQSQIANIK